MPEPRVSYEGFSREERFMHEFPAVFPELSIWEDDQAAFRQWNHYSWLTKPAFFSVFWPSHRYKFSHGRPSSIQTVDGAGL